MGSSIKTSIKTSLIIIALGLLACLVWLVWLGSRPDESDEPVGESVSNPSGGPSFEVRVEKPRMDRFLGGILPTKLEAKLFGGEDPIGEKPMADGHSNTLPKPAKRSRRWSAPFLKNNEKNWRTCRFSAILISTAYLTAPHSGALNLENSLFSLNGLISTGTSLVQRDR